MSRKLTRAMEGLIAMGWTYRDLPMPIGRDGKRRRRSKSYDPMEWYPPLPLVLETDLEITG